MRNAAILTCLIPVLASAQEKSANQQIATPVALRELVSPPAAVQRRYAPADIQIVGLLSYGEVSAPVAYSVTPRYRGFVFSGFGGDIVDIAVKSASARAFVALADGSLNDLGSGTSHLQLRLPYRGPDAEAWYVVFRNTDNKAARFTVQLRKIMP